MASRAAPYPDTFELVRRASRGRASSGIPSRFVELQNWETAFEKAWPIEGLSSWGQYPISGTLAPGYSFATATELMVEYLTPPTKPLGMKPANPSPCILVVEDEFPIRQFHTHVLLRSGYQVDTAEDGLVGWKALHTHQFDLLITDHHMPRLSGLGLVRKVRSARMPLPVILVTTPLPEQKLNQFQSLELAAALPKPFSPYQLEQTVKKVLRATHCTGTRTALPVQNSYTLWR